MVCPPPFGLPSARHSYKPYILNDKGVLYKPYVRFMKPYVRFMQRTLRLLTARTPFACPKLKAAVHSRSWTGTVNLRFSPSAHTGLPPSFVITNCSTLPIGSPGYHNHRYPVPCSPPPLWFVITNCSTPPLGLPEYHEHRHPVPGFFLIRVDQLHVLHRSGHQDTPNIDIPITEESSTGWAQKRNAVCNRAEIWHATGVSAGSFSPIQPPNEFSIKNVISAELKFTHSKNLHIELLLSIMSGLLFYHSIAMPRTVEAHCPRLLCQAEVGANHRTEFHSNKL